MSGIDAVGSTCCLLHLLNIYIFCTYFSAAARLLASVFFGCVAAQFPTARRRIFRAAYIKLLATEHENFNHLRLCHTYAYGKDVRSWLW